MGKGNRRLYCVFLLAASLAGWVYFFAAKWTHYNVYCAQYKGNVRALCVISDALRSLTSSSVRANLP